MYVCIYIYIYVHTPMYLGAGGAVRAGGLGRGPPLRGALLPRRQREAAHANVQGRQRRDNDI